MNLFLFFRPTPFDFDAKHAAGIIRVILKDNMTIKFLGYKIIAAARSLNTADFSQHIAGGLDKLLKEMKKRF